MQDHLVNNINFLHLLCILITSGVMAAYLEAYLLQAYFSENFSTKRNIIHQLWKPRNFKLKVFGWNFFIMVESANSEPPVSNRCERSLVACETAPASESSHKRLMRLAFWYNVAVLLIAVFLLESTWNTNGFLIIAKLKLYVALCSLS